MAARLEAFVAAEEGVASGDVGVAGLRRLAGGASRELWALDLELAGRRLELVLRRDPPGRAGEGDRGLEVQLLRAAAGVPVPRVHWSCADPALLGSGFFLMDRVPGEAIPRRLLRDPRYAAARAGLTAELGTILARLHRIDPARPELADLAASQAGLGSGSAEVQRIGEALRNLAVEPHPVLGFRTLENLLDGHGLRWNVDERVQVFTHPLWLLLHVPFRALSGEVFYTTIALSCTLSVGAFWVGSRLLVAPPLWMGALLALPLLVSQAFLDYATSGLETPASFLLLALFAVGLLGPREASPRRQALLAGLAALNRLDLVLLFAPALASVLLRAGRRGVGAAALGFAPLAVWELFSLLYYGAPFPNTRYAKLPSNAVLEWHLANGSRYGMNLVQQDPLSAALLVAALALAAASALAWATGRDTRPSARGAALLGAGIAVYCAYVVAIGGDFMQGRFFAVPVFASALVLWSALPAQPVPVPKRLVAAALAVLALLGVRWLAVRQPWFDSGSGIRDERAFYAETNRLWSALGGNGPGRHLLAAQGATARGRAEQLARSGSGDRHVVTASSVGMLGYYAGPEVIVVDSMGLTDPLLARLPVWRPLRMRIGHPRRLLPDGYTEALRSGSLDEMDPELRRYYEALRRITRAPLFAAERLATLVRFWLGAYDGAREGWIERERLRSPGSPAREAGGAPRR